MGASLMHPRGHTLFAPVSGVIPDRYRLYLLM